MTEVNPQLSPAKKNYAKPLFFSALTLVSGIIIGVAATLLVIDNKYEQDRLKGLEFITERMVDMMVHELTLTPEQKEQIQPIVKEHFGNIEKIRGDVRPLIREQFEEMNDELMSVLDEQQKQLWEERIRRMKEHFPRMRQRRDSGPDRRGPGPRNFRDQDGQRPDRPPEFSPDGSPPVQQDAPPQPMPPQEPSLEESD